MTQTESERKERNAALMDVLAGAVGVLSGAITLGGPAGATTLGGSLWAICVAAVAAALIAVLERKKLLHKPNDD
jgi:amino acid transporter